jgi:hypothetical protein
MDIPTIHSLKPGLNIRPNFLESSANMWAAIGVVNRRGNEKRIIAGRHAWAS